MKKRICKLNLLSLVLLAPSLMATTSQSDESIINYTDFNVSVKNVDENIYEFTINNFGDGYIPKDTFTRYDQNRSVSHFQYISETEYDSKSIQLIKPKEICTIKVHPKEDESSTALEEGYINGFETNAYFPNESIRYATGPYTASFSRHSEYNTLDIDCAVNVVKQTIYKYSYYYAITWTYEGKEYCSMSESVSKIKYTISIPFESETIINPDNVIVSKIDSFMSIDHGEENSKPPSDASFSSMIMAVILTISIIGGLIPLVICLLIVLIAVTTKKKKKQNNAIS
ncbi:MAG: hypothetical protein J6T15_03030 [Bacilli bacterium]|nr:hypothetical protein [Bacilli bacterium]